MTGRESANHTSSRSSLATTTTRSKNNRQQYRRASNDDMDNLVYPSGSIGSPSSSSAMRRSISLNETANHHRRYHRHQRASMTGVVGSNATWNSSSGMSSSRLGNINRSAATNAFLAASLHSNGSRHLGAGEGTATTAPTSYLSTFSSTPVASVFENENSRVLSASTIKDRLAPVPTIKTTQESGVDSSSAAGAAASTTTTTTKKSSGGTTTGGGGGGGTSSRNIKRSTSTTSETSSNHNMVISPSAGLLSASAASSARARRRTLQQRSRIYDDPAIVAGYNSVPLLRMDRLPRGGISLETKAIGRIQFGIPPETIKDSMSLGIGVPRVYIVPVERFSREMGPALGINLAEFEFPAYFNYFVKQCQCTLVVDSLDAEENIRRVFGETFLGPAQFRAGNNNNGGSITQNEEEDFDPSFPRSARPNFYKEFYHFRTAEASTNYEEMTIDTLIEFCHFKGSHTRGLRTSSLGGSGSTMSSSVSSTTMTSSFRQSHHHSLDRLGVPPTLTPDHFNNANNNNAAGGNMAGNMGDGTDAGEGGDHPTTPGGGTTTARRHTTFVPSDSAVALAAHMTSSVAVNDDFDDSTRLLAEAVDHLLIGTGCMDMDDDDYYDEYGNDSSVSTAGGGGGGLSSQRPPLRRTMSDPDLHARKNSMDNSHQDNAGSGSGVGGTSSYHRHRHHHSHRRGSLDSTGSFLSRRSRDGMSWASGASFMLASDDEDDPSRNSWMYSQAKWLGDVATVYPPDATEEQKATNDCARVEIFKMTGGTEYIIHDVNADNIIVGKARFSGTVRVPDEMAVEGFLAQADVEEDEEEDDDFDDDDEDSIDIEADVAHQQQQGSGSTGMGVTTTTTNTASTHHRPKASIAAPTFHPPSFGVTVLGNSHGFDKNGSVSGYVLWVNGRGIMIDPPPYSSATLEREGIRPQMIMAIIITHCHADHDAGAFQKVMTGSRVAIITTPTIYKSFIRKYAALSGLSPTLLRHSHRHRPAIVGQQLKFQGATFEFTYTLHTIPCIAFRVEWRGRSVVFTGDHLNSPKMITNLENLGVFTKARADDLRRLPLQECDVLLHEAGVPPIHTPISELMQLPEEVKKRLYVVHTSAIPKDSGLKVAPTGTARTIRLDENMGSRQQGQQQRQAQLCPSCGGGTNNVGGSENLVVPPAKGVVNGVRHHAAQQQPSSSSYMPRPRRQQQSISQVGATTKKTNVDRDETESSLSMDDFREDDDDDVEDVVVPIEDEYAQSSASDLWRRDSLVARNIISGKTTSQPRFGPGQKIPRVFLRPTCVSDAWFILNLLSNVPFLSSLSYANTMEVLEIAMVEMFCAHEVVIAAHRRPEVLCVVWEGTCIEREPVIDICTTATTTMTTTLPTPGVTVVDPTTMLNLSQQQQIDDSNSLVDDSNNTDHLHDVIVPSEDHAFDRRGVGVGGGNSGGRSATIWHAGDWTGPLALQPDTCRSADALMGEVPKDIVALSEEGVKVIMLNMKDLHQILKSGSKLFRKYLVLQEKQAAEEAAIQAQSHDHIENGAIGIDTFPSSVGGGGLHDNMDTSTGYTTNEPNSNNDNTTNANNMISQPPTPRWYNSYDSVLEVLKCNSALGKLTALQKRHLESLAEGPRFFDANSYLWQVGKPVDFAYLVVAGTAVFANKPEEPVFVSRRGSTGTMSQTALPQPTRQRIVEHHMLPMIEEDRPLSNIAPNSEYARLEIGLQLRVEEMELDAFEKAQDLLPKEERMRNARDRFANKVLARLYSRRAYTNGLVFSRGHLLSDTSRMVSGSLAHIHHTGSVVGGAGATTARHHQEISSMMSNTNNNSNNNNFLGAGGQQGQLSGDHHCHTSNMAAGAEGCVVLVFPRSSLVQFLDGNPGVLLSLLGTQVVV